MTLGEHDIMAIEQQIPKLRRFACARVGDPVLADDLVQDCLERTIRHFDKFQQGTNLQAWMFTILRNVQINHYRKQQRRSEVAISDDGYELPSIAPSQEHTVEFRDFVRSFAQLSEEHKEILLLIVVEGFKYDEAADILGLPVGTVRSRIFRARAKLREIEDKQVNVQEAKQGPDAQVQLKLIK